MNKKIMLDSLLLLVLLLNSHNLFVSSVSLTSTFQKTNQISPTTTSSLDQYVGKWFQIVNSKNLLCFQMHFNAPLIQSKCETTGTFAWTIYKNNIDGTFNIKSLKGDYFLDYNSSSTVTSFRKTGKENQKWIIDSNNEEKETFMVKNKVAQGKCIEVNQISQVRLIECNENSPLQEFQFKIFTPLTARMLINDNDYTNKIVSIKSTKTGKCLKFSGPSKNLVQDDCENTANFGWKISYNAIDNTYFISSMLGNFVLDNSRSRRNNGNPILTYVKHGGNNQRWFIHLGNSESFIFKGKQSQKCIDIPAGSTDNYKLLQIWDCQMNGNQNFIFTPLKPILSNSLLKTFVNKYIQIVHPSTGNCLKFDKPNSRLLTFECLNLKNQAWKLIYNIFDDSYMIESTVGRYLFDNRGGSTRNGNPILTWRAVSNVNQKWKIKSFSGNSFYIEGLQSAKCLDVPEGKDINNLGMQLWDCIPGNKNQEFIFREVDIHLIQSSKSTGIYSDNFFKIQNKKSGKCFAMKFPNQSVYQADCEDSDEFAWKFSLNDDQTSYVTSKIGNYVIDNKSNKFKNGNDIINSIRKSGDSQRWYIVPWDQNSWRFIGKESGMSINVKSGSNQNSAIIQLWDSIKGNQNQAFNILPFGQKAIIRGYIKNALTNIVINDKELESGNIKIEFVSGSNIIQSSILPGGIYEATLPKGSYLRNVSLKKYSNITQTIEVINSINQFDLSTTILMNPEIEGFRIVLTWGKSPKDLISHLILPNNEDINYTNKVSSDKKVKLNLDSITGSGPETITLNGIEDGIYKFFVNNFSKEAPLSSSEAKVMLYKGSELITEVNIKKDTHIQSSYWWHALSIDATNKNVIVFNKITDSMN